ncbi:MAG: cob(I)yrinic acid a,c-diamide adenosyltransferase [Butyricicoccus sp.]
MNKTGLIHIYCGDGKGKTTAAMGLALRCAGHGEKVVIAQFLKDGTSGESRLLAKLDNVTLLAANPVGKFSKAMNEAEREESEQAMARTFRAAVDFAVREHARMLVLDEVCAAITTGMLEEWDVLEFLDDKPKDLEVVLTGRNPTLRMQERADYISEICKRKHPFDRGIRAREGIEK